MEPYESNELYKCQDNLEAARMDNIEKWLKVQDLEQQVKSLRRQLDNAGDINRAAEHLYRVITIAGNDTTGGPFGKALASLGEALRNAHDMDGGGR
jgi:hypothetical protein